MSDSCKKHKKDNCKKCCERGPRGHRGHDGVAGLPGPTGAQGLPGPTGAQGLPGPTGAQGLPGPTGEQGLPGPTGAQGLPGPTGAQGLPGPTGAQGLPGPTGAQGLPGLIGPEGPTGAQGLIGPEGPTGAQGPTGPSGSSNILNENIEVGTYFGPLTIINEEFPINENNAVKGLSVNNNTIISSNINYIGKIDNDSNIIVNNINNEIIEISANIKVKEISSMIYGSKDFGYQPIAKLCAGHPAFVYYNDAIKSLCFTQSENDSGQNITHPKGILPVWLHTIILVENFAFDIGGEYKQLFSFEIVNGNPAITYYHNGNLMYMRALDSQGNTWNDPITIDLNCGSINDLKIINGYPAVAYFDEPNYRLKYIRATDINGIGWNNPIIPNNDEKVINSLSLTTINNKPAIAITVYNGILDKLFYISALDTSGTVWQPYKTVYSANDNGDIVRNCVMVQLNGDNIGIAFILRIQFQNYIKYLYTTDNGTNWNLPTLGFNNSPISSNCLRSNISLYVSDTIDLLYLNNTNDLYLLESSNSIGDDWLQNSKKAENTRYSGKLNGNVYYRNINTGCIYFNFNNTLLFSALNGSISMAATTTKGDTPGIVINNNSHHLKYLLATDVNGTNFEVKGIVEDTSLSMNPRKFIHLFFLPPTNGHMGVTFTLDDNDETHFFYYNTIDNGVTWTSQYTNQCVNNTEVTSCVINGDVCVAYNYIDNTFRFERIGDAPSLIENNFRILFCSMQALTEVGGGIGIAYLNDYDTFSTKVNYAYSLDNGSTWSIVQLNGHNKGFSIKLLIIEGFPTVVYFDTTTLYYQRAKNATGSEWYDPIPLISSIIIAPFEDNISFQLINGKPAITYTTIINDKHVIKYMRALDKMGNQWEDPIIIQFLDDMDMNNNTYQSLALINKNPAIVYYNHNNRSIQYTRFGHGDLYLNVNYY